MIEELIIEQKEDTPRVYFSKEKNIFEIIGRSMPENVNILFNPIFQWLIEYFKEPLNETHISINLDYFNSASTKKIVELLILLEKEYEKGVYVKLLWFHKKNDFIIQKKGNELLGLFKFPFDSIAT